MSSSAGTSIAIVGVGCRFPGGVNDTESLWRLLSSGGDAIVDVPPDRWSTDKFFSDDPTVPGKTYVRRGGFLRDPIDRFDPLFFGISPREAQHMDPQQRLLLEVAWEAMEEAGLIPSQLAGSLTGVYVGGFALDAMTILMSPYGRALLDTHHAATAASMTMLAARVSYIFDFRGPSVTMDTACSSSLVALHYACRGLIERECDLALAGGVNVMISAEYPIIMSKGHFLARDGHCKSFDAKADGYSRGEGCGLVLLKRLDDALRDGDRIRAVIDGTGVNQDGRTDGITVPSAGAQEALIRAVYAKAQVPLSAVRYVEAHGTGTPVGDPLEAAALGRTLGAGRAPDSPLIVGSIKANIGHLEAAAGVAGVIKAVLCLEHGQVPPQIHLDEPNPAIPFADLGLTLPLAALDLVAPAGEALYVGVNSFGYGGTNAHAVLRAHPAPRVPAAARTDGGAVVLPISARSEASLRLMASRFAAALTAPDGPPPGPFAAAAALERSQFDHRLAVVGSSSAELARRLTAFVAEGAAAGVVVGRSRAGGLAFVFAGMGPQWWGMGQSLLENEPVFRAMAEECDRIFTALAGWSICAEMRRPEAESRMGETRVAQPANFVLQVALAALLGDLGVEPDAVVGHSVGEVAAAFVSGALALEDAVRVVYHRSRLQQTTAGSGTMLAVGLGAAEVASRLAGRADMVSLAAVNSARSVTLAGDAAALRSIADGLEDEGVFHRFLQVEVPYHSPLMEPLQPELLASLAGLRPCSPTLPLYSTVTGARWAQSALHDGAYWFRNLRDPVLFAPALDALITDGHGLFAEIGPHPVLSSAIRDGLTGRAAAGDSVYSLHRKNPEAGRILAMVAELYTLGRVPDWRRINGEPIRGTRIPTYAWDRDRYWVENAATRYDRFGYSGHPILGMPMPVAAGSMWTADLNANYLPWLTDHQVDETTVFPGAGYVEACLAMHAAVDGSDPAIVENLDLTRALVLNPAAGTELQWTFDAKTRACTAASREHGSEGAWQAHAAATILASAPWAVPARDAAAITARCPLEIDVAALYAALNGRGLKYGPAFRCLRELRRGSAEVLARLALDERDAPAAERYRVHPAMLDAAFQALIAACTDAGPAATLFMPVAMRQVQYHAPVGPQAFAHCRLVAQTAEGIEGDVAICSADGTVLLEVKGVRCVAVGQRGAGDAIPLDRWMYDYSWQAAESAAGFAEPARWLVFSDEAGVGPALVRYLRNQGADAVIEVVHGEGYACLDDERFQIRRGCADDMAQVLAEAGAAGCRGIIYLWGADPSLNDPAVDPTGLAALGDAITLVKALCREPAADDAPRPRLYVVTREAQHVDESLSIGGLAAAALVGFMRVVALEAPELRATLVDLDPQTAPTTSGRRLGQEILAGSAEDDVALRGPTRYVHRLLRRSQPRGAETLVPLTQLGPQAAYRLEIGVPGSLEKVRYAEVARRAPGEHEIELRIQAVGLNFKDVLKVLGMMSKSALDGTHYGSALGMEASAVVVAVGPGVKQYAVGDEIVALVAGSLASHLTIRVDQLLSAKRPAGMSAADGATIPIAFMTAYYGLVEAARLRPGEKVLIHAGAGGVGMAAIQVAKWLGAEIYATAGSPEKRDLLLSLGVSRVWSSRTLEFVDGIREATAGRGVDVVLNSLSGEAMERSFDALAPLGRFIEIGKRDIVERSRLPMAAFDRSVSFSALDLDRLTLTNLDAIVRLFGDAWKHVESGAFAPLPVTRFGAAGISDALRYMVQAKQVGKIVVDFEAETDVEIVPLAVRRELVRADATYLVTGAFGGVGAELVRLLVDAGARHLVLAGRSGARSEAAVALLAEIRERGVDAREARVDVADPSAVGKLLGEVAASMPPLRGVFHAAAVLDDGLIANLDAARVAAVMAPKALGAWVLHEETRHIELDWFVLFSSATSLMGNPGQSSYVAANAFLDALARQRRALGLPATAINWGAIGDVGMLAEDTAATRGLERAGVHRIPVASAMAVLPRAVGLDSPVIAVMDVEWAKWTAVFPVVKDLPRFSVLVAEDASANAGADYRAALLALPVPERLPVLTTAIIGLVAEALHLMPEKIDRCQPLTDLGIDSLVGVELQASIGAKLGLQISILQLMKGGNIEEMAATLLAKMSSGSAAAVPRTVETPAPPADGEPNPPGDEQIAA